MSTSIYQAGKDDKVSVTSPSYVAVKESPLQYIIYRPQHGPDSLLGPIIMAHDLDKLGHREFT